MLLSMYKFNLGTQMSKISNIISDIKAWVNAGTTNEIFIRRVLVVSLTLLVIYKLGYAIGVFLAHIGL